MTQLHDQDSLLLILPSGVIWNLIRVLHLRWLITLIYLVSVWLQLKQDVVVVVVEAKQINPVCLHRSGLIRSLFFNCSLTAWKWSRWRVSLCSMTTSAATGLASSDFFNPWSVSFSFSQGTLKISLPYSPTKTLSVKSILRWEVSPRALSLILLLITRCGWDKKSFTGRDRNHIGQSERRTAKLSEERGFIFISTSIYSASF